MDVFFSLKKIGIPILYLLLLIWSSSCKQKNIPESKQNLVSVISSIDTLTQKKQTNQLVQTSSPLEIPPLTNFVRRIFEEKNGTLWFGTNGDGVIRYNGSKLEFFSIENGFAGVAVRSIITDDEGIIWFGTERGLSKYDGDSFINFTEQDGLLNNDIWSLCIDHRGMLWVATLQGICLFDGVHFIPFDLPETNPDYTRGVTSSKIVHSIMQDSNNNMWFGTNGGAYKYDGKSLLNLSEQDGLSNNSVNDILEDGQGTIWFATHHGGVSSYDEKSFTNHTLNGNIKGNEVWSLYEDQKGNIWFPAEGFGLYRYDGNSFTNFNKKEGLQSSAIQTVYEDQKGRIWAGGWKGLFRYDGTSFISVYEHGPWP